MANSNGRSKQRPRKTRNTFVTKSGKAVKVNRNISQRVRDWKEDLLIKKATRLAGMPKSRAGRFFYRLRPINMYRYWFSREGAIMALKVTGLGIVCGFVILIGLAAYFRKDLPAIDSVYGQNLGGSISFYDRTGKTLLWEDYNAVKRLPVPGSQISPYLKDATVAIEDRNFYHEGAIDPRSIVRAAYNDLFHPNNNLQGASTITEQVVKLNENWIGQRSIWIKIQEVILASELERQYSKNDILTAYLNIVPYGGVDYGAQTAANDYFNEQASQLTIAQSAFLASIPQSPAVYSPWSPEFSQSALQARMQYILKLMVQQGYITQAQANANDNINALMAQVHTEPENKYNGIIAPYFDMAALNQLYNQFGTQTVEKGGWRVITTLDLPTQQHSEQVIQSDLRTMHINHADEAAVVTENAPTGQVTSLVGGVDFNNPNYGQINYATLPINPGSSYKLFDYTALFNYSTNAGAGSVLYDSKGPLPGYPCTTGNLTPLEGGNCLEDYDFKFPGPITLRYALGGSRNIPAVKTMLITGVQKTINLSEQMGLTSGYNCYANTMLTQTTQCYDSAAIGDGAYLSLNQEVNGYATDARLGSYVPQTYILKIIDSSGKTLYQWSQPKPDQVVKPDAAYIVDNILADPRASYLPGYCTATNCTPLSQGGYKFHRYNGWDVAIKTGTTNFNYDGLMFAMTSQNVVGVWVGYHTREVSLGAYSGGEEAMTEPLARGMIDYMTTGPPQNWVQPADIKVLPAYVQTTHIDYGDQEPGPSTDLYPAWYIPPANNGKSYTIDKVSGMLATSCTPALAQETVGAGYSANVFSIDPFVAGSAASATNSKYNLSQYDDVHQCSDIKPSIVFNDAGNTVTCQSNSCTVTVTITQGTHPLSSSQFPTQINMIINGKTIAATCNFGGADLASVNSASGTCTFNYAGTAGQTYQVTGQVIDSVLYTGTTTSPDNIVFPAPTSSAGPPNNDQNTTGSTTPGGTPPGLLKKLN